MGKILIMDDEPGLRNIVFNILKPLGHSLFIAEDGNQAIVIAKNENPDVALLDMRVPDMDGLEVLSELKRMNPNIKCVMLSGFGDVESAVFAIKQGAFDYLSKPFKIDEVIKVVNKAFQQSAGVSSPAVASHAAVPVIITSETPVSYNNPNSVSAPAKNKIFTEKLHTKKTFQFAFIFSGIVILSMFLLFISKTYLVNKKIHEFVIPYYNPTGMCWIESRLWVSDWVTGSIYKHNTDSKLSLISVFNTKNAQPSGLAFDGSSLWTCNAIEKKLYKHNIDAALTITNIYNLPYSSIGAIYFDGSYIWIAGARIYKHKIDESLTLVGTYESPVTSPCGMFKYGDYYYIGDFKTNKIFKHTVTGLTVVEVYSIPDFDSKENKLSGLSFDGENIWVCSDGVQKLYKFDIDDLVSVKF